MKGIGLRIKLQLLAATIIFLVLFITILKFHIDNIDSGLEALDKEINHYGEMLSIQIAPSVGFEHKDSIAGGIDDVLELSESIIGIKILKGNGESLFYEQHKRGYQEKRSLNFPIRFDEADVGKLILYYSDKWIMLDSKLRLYAAIKFGIFLFLAAIIALIFLSGRIYKNQEEIKFNKRTP